MESSADTVWTTKPLTIGLVAGEVSGDLLGAGLIAALKRRLPNARFVGIAGPRMQEQGCVSLYDMDELTVLGIFEALGKVVRILWIRLRMVRYFRKHRPDVFIGVDAPDFNLGLEKRLRTVGIPCVHYVSPTVWAWRRYRLRTIHKAVDHMLTLLPFEARFYEERNIPVTFVGHPMAEQIPMEPDRMAAREQLGLPGDDVIIALLPGSRRSELERHSDLFIDVVRWVHQRNKKVRFVCAPVNDATRAQFEEAIKRNSAGNLPITLVTGRAREVMTVSDVVVLASGTAALEAALLKRPMVVTYKVSFLTYVLVKLLSHVRYYSMPNNLAGREMVPELLQYNATPEKIGRAVERFLSHPEEVEQLIGELNAMHEDLRRNGDETAAGAVIEVLGAHSVR